MEVKETKLIAIPFDPENHSRVEQKAEAEHLPTATWCRRILLMYLEGRLVEANGHKTEKCLETCD